MRKLISYTFEGDFNNTRKFLKSFRDSIMLFRIRSLFTEYGNRIVSELQSNTPKRTGATAASWYYEIVQDSDNLSLEIHNDHMGDDGKTPVAILIQMGHGTRTGGYVPPNDYINPVIEPLFKELSEKITEVVKSS